MTGESRPIRRYPGVSVHASTVVEEGWLTVEARAVGSHTRFANIVRLLEESTTLDFEMKAFSRR